jgi:peptidyl-tRNA hydrolase
MSDIISYISYLLSLKSSWQAIAGAFFIHYVYQHFKEKSIAKSTLTVIDTVKSLSSYPIHDNYSVLDGEFKMVTCHIHHLVNLCFSSYILQVLCVNSSLQMGKGKIGAQCGHATLGAYKLAEKCCKSALGYWEIIGQAKIAVKVDDDDSMVEIMKQAKSRGLVTYMVQDAGRTQIPAGSKTVLAIGPAPGKAFTGLTDHLKLL